MFVTDDPALVWNLYFYYSIVLENHTLASKTGFQPGIDCPVDKILFLI
jgi:hypothetical protein